MLEQLRPGTPLADFADHLHVRHVDGWCVVVRAARDEKSLYEVHTGESRLTIVNDGGVKKSIFIGT